MNGDRLRSAIEHAILAPSGHNTQPWRFALDGGVLELRADRTRGLAVVDPDDRELVMSCGAALLNLRVALRRRGCTAAVETVPDERDPDLLARVRLGPERPATAEDIALFEAIERRATNRFPFAQRPLDRALLARLRDAVGHEGAILVLAEGERPRAELTDLVAEGDRAQFSDRRFRRELAAWVRPNTSGAGDGIRAHAFGLSNLASHAGPLAIRTFDTGKRQARKDADLARRSAELALIATDADTPAAWLAAGQALERLLLTAAGAGVAASFLNQPIEVPQLRPGVAQAVGQPELVPQLLLRLGYPTEDAGPQPRRPVEEVLDQKQAERRSRSR